jgi:hypothetical protein
MLSKAPLTSVIGAFVLPAASCANRQVQKLVGPAPILYSGKPYVSSAFSYNSDPKPQRLQQFLTPRIPTQKSPLKAI